jgi:hypothetical protein
VPDGEPTLRSAGSKKGSAPPPPNVPVVTMIEAGDLRLDDANPNKHTERGVYMVETSLERYGAARSIVASADGKVLAGNATAQAAIEKGFRLAQVEVDGKTLVVVKRTDLPSDDPRAIEYKVADNRASEVGLAWDAQVLADMQEQGLDLGEFFHAEELAKLIDGSPGSGGAHGAPALTDKYALVVEVVTEADQLALIEELTGRGLACRALTS